jgi:hypothetical protein
LGEGWGRVGRVFDEKKNISEKKNFVKKYFRGRNKKFLGQNPPNPPPPSSIMAV